MSRLITVVFLLMAIPQTISAAEEEVMKRLIFIGIPTNSAPYINNNEGKITGILNDIIEEICQTAGVNCQLVPDTFDNNLLKLQQSKINALLTINSIMIPESDNVKLSSALCKTKPVFITYVGDKEALKIPVDELMAGKNVGVALNSQLHLMLLDNYYNSIVIRPYETLEVGIFDLYFQKLDLIFTEETYYDGHLLENLLVDQRESRLLTKYEIEGPDMSSLIQLATKDKDEELYNLLEKIIQKREIKRCAQLVADSESKKAAPHELP